MAAVTGTRDRVGPYFQAMFPPRRVTPWINFKRMSTGVNIARRLWDQREGLRQEYEALHGTNHAQWPTQHPGIVLDAVRWVAHPACLFDRWFRRGRRAITTTQFVDPDTESTKVELRSGHRLEPGDNVTANLTLWPALADPALDMT